MRFQPCLTQSANDWRWSQDWEATQAIPLTTIYLHKASATKDTTTTCLNINIRSAATGTLMVPRARTATGQRSFAVNRLATWNRLLPALVHYGHRIHRIASSSGHWRRPVLDHPASLRRPHDSSAGYKYPDLLTYRKLSELYCVHTSRIFGTGSPGLLFSAIVLAHARPNTTRSSSELAPSRFAPCTETHADSPALYRPRTTLSFPFTWSITCTSNKSSRQCDCYSTTTMCCTDLIKRLTTDPLQETLTID